MTASVSLIGLQDLALRLGAWARSAGAAPEHQQRLATITLGRSAYFAIAQQLADDTAQPFGATDTFTVIVGDGYAVRVEPESVTT